MRPRDTHEEFLYTCDDGAERIDGSDPDDAIRQYLDNYAPGELPATVTLYRYRRGVVPNDIWGFVAERVLDTAIEYLDEEYGDPDEATEPTEAMRVAATAFVDAMRTEYVPWNCELDGQEEIDVAKWVKENAPEWLAVQPPLARQKEE